MWTKQDLHKLYSLVKKENLTYAQAARALNKTRKSCESKFLRINWASFFKNENSVDFNPQPWTREQLILLYSLKKEAHLSFKEISLKMGRTLLSCDNKYQETDWKEFMKQNDKSGKFSKNQKDQAAESLANHMVNLSRNNIDILEEMSKAYFIEKANIKEGELPIPFKEIKEVAKNILHKMGLCFEAQKHLGEGTYIIVGDSHGKHTKRNMFKLIKNLSDFVRAKNVIHIGHILDDDNDFSYCWKDLKNLIILAKREELQPLSQSDHKFNIVRNEIFLGNLAVCNQDEIGDYTNTYVGKMKKQVFPNTTVVNLHRHELDTRTTSDGTSQIMSPGCLCEKHVVRTIKQVDWEEGKQVKLAYWDGFSKYRRMRHRYVFWEQGILIVHVDSNDNFDVFHSRIQKTSKGFTTSYYNKIITEMGVVEPDEKGFFNGDIHVKKHDEKILDLQEQFCNDYKPSFVINIGDIHDNKSLNHHLMSRNGWAIQSDLLDEIAGVHYVLKNMRKWGKKFHLLFGNHERFTKDFVEKLPQFKSMLEFGFVTNLESLDVNLVPHKKILRMGNVNFIHGDLKMFGAKGDSKHEKVSQCIGENTIFGDVHYAAIRYGCYSVGISGKMDQDYNETTASRWIHGFGYWNTFEGKSFISLVNIANYRFSINNKKFTPKNPSKWIIPLYKASLSYTFK